MRKIKVSQNIVKIIKGYRLDEETHEERIRNICSTLKAININTQPKQLINAQLRKVEYHWYYTKLRTRTLWRNEYLAVKTIGEDNIEQEEYFVQNHEIGSSEYNIYKVRSLQR